jgi:hypothetical protein
MPTRRVWLRRGLVLALSAVGGQQLWRHGHDYVFADQFAEIEPGKVYRGAWQKSWPMRRIVRRYRIKTIVALAHPAGHPLSVQERALARELGVRWVHLPIVDDRTAGDKSAISDRLEQAAALLADPRNQPVYFHCHHGINRATMVQVAYRTKECGWTLDRALAEIDRTFGLRAVNHGPDYRHMEEFYADRVLPERRLAAGAGAGASSPASARR